MEATVENTPLIKSMPMRDPRITELDGNRKISIEHFQFNRKSDEYNLVGLDRVSILETAHAAGFRKHQNGSSFELVRVQHNIIESVTPELVKMFFQELVESETQPLSFIHNGISVECSRELLRDVFAKQSHLIFNSEFLQLIKPLEKEIQRDTKDECIKAFQNCIIKITPDGIEEISYNDWDGGYFWRDHIIKRPFTLYEYDSSYVCDFKTFLHDVCDNDTDRIVSAGSAIGYMLHGYSSASQNQAIILTDAVVPDPKNPQGRTGKGIFWHAIAELTNTVKVDGKRYNEKSQFTFQQITLTTNVVTIDDPKSNFPFDSIFSSLSDGMTIERKFQTPIVIRPEHSPKVLIATNTPPKGEGSSFRGRQFYVMFGDYFSKQIVNGTEEPVKQKFGREFFTEAWDNDEWNKFYLFMLQCVNYYLCNGLKYVEPVNLIQNKIRTICGDEFYAWVTQDPTPITKGIKLNTSELFNQYREASPNDNLTQRGFTNILKSYAAITGMTANVSRSNNTNYITLK